MAGLLPAGLIDSINIFSICRNGKIGGIGAAVGIAYPLQFTILRVEFENINTLTPARSIRANKEVIFLGGSGGREKKTTPRQAMSAWQKV